MLLPRIIVGCFKSRSMKNYIIIFLGDNMKPAYLDEYDLDLGKVHDELNKLGEELAEAEASLKLHEEFRKSEKAKLTNQNLANAKSISQAESMTLASEEYKQLINDEGKLIKDYRISKIRYDSYITGLDLWRTKQSTQRQAMKL